MSMANDVLLYIFLFHSSYFLEIELPKQIRNMQDIYFLNSAGIYIFIDPFPYFIVKYF